MYIYIYTYTYTFGHHQVLHIHLQLTCPFFPALVSVFMWMYFVLVVCLLVQCPCASLGCNTNILKLMFHISQDASVVVDDNKMV
jgi:hypothetical protein